MCTLQGILISCTTDKPLGSTTEAQGEWRVSVENFIAIIIVMIIIVSVDRAHNFYLRIRCSKSPRQRAGQGQGQGMCLGPWRETILRQPWVKVGGFLCLCTAERARQENLENGPHVYFKGRLFIISVCASGSSMCEEMAKQRKHREHSLKIIILNNNKRQPNAQFLLRCCAALHIRVSSPCVYCILNMWEGTRKMRQIPCNNSTTSRTNSYTHTDIHCCWSVRKGRGLLRCKDTWSGYHINFYSSRLEATVFPIVSFSQLRSCNSIPHSLAIYRVSKGYACVWAINN